ncbi:hypothetical protein PI484_005102 [Klebsiella pneumoniae]|uniref:hypothetical protein n=1 Tax=Klebsiella pneumoniae TaxID=573 RepID=UPI0025C9DFA0|nr:hypothetical protein [Klebsiella pneumoniae]HBQ9395312.1 hypothetical protein [Klebsiella pneumoniae]HBV7172690.1 ead/Ea22-like family protein [Klebsiella pneumoniae]
MTDITELAQRMKTAAEKLDADQWQTRKGFSGIEVIVKGSLEKGHGCVSFQPVAADMADTKTARAIALFSPANVLALVEALENSESRLHEVAVACATAEQALEKAQQQTTESENRVRKQNRHICELFDDNTALRQRIAELESRTVTVKLPKPHAHLIWIQAGHAPDDYWDDVAVSHSEKDRCCDGSERYPVYARWEIEEMLAAAGIKVEAE